MSKFDMRWRPMARVVLSVVVGVAATHAQASQTQAVAPVTLPQGGGGVDGPFFPTNRPLPVAPSTGAQLQQEAQRRIDAHLGGKSALSNNASITKSQAQSNGLGFIAEHFDQIDSAHTGRVSLSDVRKYLQQQKSQ